MIRSILTAALTVGVLSFAACGDDPSFPPEACAIIPEQTINVGESKTVPVCFNDADGHEVTLSATSSDDGVAAARIQRSALIVEAVDVGDALISVTATDPDGKTGELSFTVAVPNREPTGSLVETLELKGDDPPFELILTEHFTDPDDHPLRFSAESSDPAIVSATVEGSLLTLTPVRSGSASVRVTATDPHGGFARGTIRLSVRVRVTLVRDDFDSGLDGWTTIPNSTVTVENGRVQVQARETQDMAGIALSRELEAEDWKISVKLEAATDAAWPVLWIYTGTAPENILIMVGANWQRLNPNEDPTNLIGAVTLGNSIVVPEGWYGLFDGIRGAGEPMEVTVRMDRSSIEVTVDSVLIHTMTYEAFGESPPTRLVRGMALANFVAPDVTAADLPNHTVFFDFVQLDGSPLSAPPLKLEGWPRTRFPALKPTRIGEKR